MRPNFLRKASGLGVAPFWFWNDDLSPDELRRQVRLMREAGVGGFFMHARMGRITPYMGERWMECVRACIEEASRLGMRAWVYDEDNWPSGYGGGAVSSLGGEYLQRNLCCLEIPVVSPVDRLPLPLPPEAELVGLFAAERSGPAGLAGVEEATRLLADGCIDARPFEGKTLLAFVVRPHTFRRWFCPEVCAWGYVDVLSPKVTDKFIELIYEPYAAVAGGELGRTLAGVFTDEPNMQEHAWGSALPILPWTGGFLQKFAERHGYDLAPHLPSLFYDWGDFHRVRYHFYELCAELFSQNFSRRLYEWCDARGLKFTGHYILEESLRMQTRCIGSAMLHYEYQHIPGIDHLGRPIELPDYWSSSNVLVKQVSSVKEQLGKEGVLCETFAGGGWDFNMADAYWQGNWMFALGVTFLCPHAFHYSLRDFRKRDYPPSFFFQQPWWPHSRPLWSHFATLSRALSAGKVQRRVLVVHPLGSVWATQRPQDFKWEEGDWITASFERLTATLLEAHLDFDYADEKLLERHGSVRAGALRVGRMEYDAVVVPPGVTLRSSTVRLLRRFAGRGGAVFGLGPVPGEVDCVPDPPLGGLGMEVPGRWDSPAALRRLVSRLREVAPPRLGVEGARARALRSMHRRVGGSDLVFLTNIEDAPARVRVTMKGAVGCREVDTVTGESRPIPAQRRGGGAVVELDVPARGARLLLFTGERTPKVEERRLRRAKLDPVVGKALSPNALLLDWADAGRGVEPLLVIRQRLEADVAERGSAEADLEFTFAVDALPQGEVSLLLEGAGGFRIELNGEPVAPVPRGWMYDPSFELVRLPGLRRGVNRLRLHRRWEHAVELEPPVILGRFGVEAAARGGSRIVAEKTLGPGPLAAQGYPFFAGEVEYVTTFDVPAGVKSGLLRLSGVRDAVAVYVNGAECGVVAWEPRECRLKGLVEGANVLRLVLATDLRNLLGPHHLTISPPCISPQDFRRLEYWTDEYVLVESGLTGDVRVFLEAVE